MVSRPLIIGLLVTATLLVAGYCMLSDEGSAKMGLDETTGHLSPSHSLISKPVITRPSPPKQGYVGSESCRECHAEIAELYAQHPMGRSMSVATDSVPALTGLESEFTVPGVASFDRVFRYSVQQAADGLVHREQAVSRTSKEVIYQTDVPVHFAVGSGKRGKSYIINHDGVLMMSPLTWYSQAKRWDLSPGFELNNRHFERRIVDGCVQCHSSHAASDSTSTNLFQKSPFHELAIGCERCHGPAQAHVNFHREGSVLGLGEETDPILNPGKFSSEKSNQVCFQCHLIGDSRLPRYGRTDFDFRPGDHITDIWTIFVTGTGIAADQTTEAVSQVDQMLSSSCYQNSDQFGCVSCHDPHQTPAPEDRHDFYRQRCLKCHGHSSPECTEDVSVRAATAISDSCIDCHMPSIAANDVPHTSQTDHRVLARPKAAKSTVAAGRYHDVRIFEGEASNLTEAEVNRANAIKMVHTAEATGGTVLAAEAIPVLQTWVSLVSDDLAAVDAMGAAFFLVDDVTSAERIWQSGLQMMPRDERFLRRLFVLYHDNGRIREAIDVGEQLIGVNDWNHEYHGRLAHLYGQAGRLRDGIASAERALELNPSAYRIHDWLAQAYAAIGNEAASQRHRDFSRALSPTP